jgi:hypothetical protein
MDKGIFWIAIGDTKDVPPFGAGADRCDFRDSAVDHDLMQVIDQSLDFDAALQIGGIFHNDVRHDASSRVPDLQRPLTRPF